MVITNLGLDKGRSRAAREGQEREAGGVDVVFLDEHELARRRRLAAARELRAAGEVARGAALALAATRGEGRDRGEARRVRRRE